MRTAFLAFRTYYLCNTFFVVFRGNASETATETHENASPLDVRAGVARKSERTQRSASISSRSRRATRSASGAGGLLQEVPRAARRGVEQAGSASQGRCGPHRPARRASSTRHVAAAHCTKPAQALPPTRRRAGGVILERRMHAANRRGVRTAAMERSVTVSDKERIRLTQLTSRGG